MSTGLKIVLGVLAGIALLIGTLVAAGLWLGRSMVNTAEDAAKFAANATHERCVTEMSGQLKACDGLSCTVSRSVWGSSCLAQAQGAREEFCGGVPSIEDSNAFLSWQGAFCPHYGLDKDKCAMAAAIVAGYCKVPEKPEKG